MAPPLSLSKKPRRVRVRRRESNEIRFFRRRVRRKKHFSPRKRGSCPPLADDECDAAGRIPLSENPEGVFRQSQRRGQMAPPLLRFGKEIGWVGKRGYTTSPEPAPSLASDHSFSNSDQSRLGRSLVQIS